MGSPEKKSLLRPLGSRPKTPGLSRPRERNDRFIPNRGGTDIENAGLLSQLDTSGSEFKCELAKQLSVNDKRLLSFKNSRPKVPEPGKPDESGLFLSAQGTRSHRYIPQHADRVLDAPDLPNDFYRNGLDWGSKNKLVVALEENLYMWDGETGDVQKVEEFEHPIHICSLKWTGSGTHIGVGLSNGTIQLYDGATLKLLRILRGHSGVVYSLSWNNETVTSGSKTGQIMNSDVRVKNHNVGWMEAHSRVVCGLAWSPNLQQIASGGSDQLLAIWDRRKQEQPLHRMEDNTATVKAVAWCPFKSKVLASGGGTGDHRIRVWDTQTGSQLNTLDTGKQVCSLLWNPYDKEILSGLDGAENQLRLWKWPAMHHVSDLLDHSGRVLHLTLSPDGCTACSGSADESLRFWKIFQKPVKPAATSAFTGCNDSKMHRVGIR